MSKQTLPEVLEELLRLKIHDQGVYNINLKVGFLMKIWPNYVWNWHRIFLKMFTLSFLESVRKLNFFRHIFHICTHNCFNIYKRNCIASQVQNVQVIAILTIILNFENAKPRLGRLHTLTSYPNITTKEIISIFSLRTFHLYVGTFQQICTLIEGCR